MFIFLSKFLPLFIYPVGLTFILLWVAYKQNSENKQIRGIILSVICVVWIAGNSWTTFALARSLEWKYEPMMTQETETRVMVLLGGGTEPAQYPREHVEVNGAGDRLVHAAILYHEGGIDTIIVSGGGISWLSGREVSASQEMEDLLVLMGVPREVIIQQDKSANTYEDAIFSSDILNEMGVDEIILVTSAMHMPRSVAVFEHEGLIVIPEPTDYKVTQVKWDTIYRPKDIEAVLMALIPRADNIGTFTNAMKEYIGMAIYSLRDWM